MIYLFFFTYQWSLLTQLTRMFRKQTWQTASHGFFQLHKKEKKNKQLHHINWYCTDSWGFIDAPSVVLLTHTGREGLVPHSPVPAEAGQGAAAMKAVSRVAGVQDKGVGVVAVVLDLVAIVGDSRLLAANQVKTYRRELRETNAHADLALPVGVTQGAVVGKRTRRPWCDIPTKSWSTSPQPSYSWFSKTCRVTRLHKWRDVLGELATVIILQLWKCVFRLESVRGKQWIIISHPMQKHYSLQVDNSILKITKSDPPSSKIEYKTMYHTVMSLKYFHPTWFHVSETCSWQVTQDRHSIKLFFFFLISISPLYISPP